MLVWAWPGFGADPIVRYDMTYTTRGDYSDPAVVNAAWDHGHAVSTLQGLVNRDAPRLYLRFVESLHGAGNIDDYWLGRVSGEGQWLQDVEVENATKIVDLVERFGDRIQGLVVYDPKVPATSNVASAVAGAEDLIAVRYDPSEGSLYRTLVVSLALPVRVWLVNPDGSSMFAADGRIPGTDRFTTGSAKCDAYLWMKERYLGTGRLNPAFGAYYIDYVWAQRPDRIPRNHHNLTNHDFFVANRAWFFDLDPWADEPASDDPGQVPGTDRRTLQELLHCAYRQLDGREMIHVGGFPPWAHKYTKSAGFRHGDVATEWEYCLLLSAYNAFKDADAIGYGAMANASFWQHFPLAESYPQPWVSHDELRRRGYLDEAGRVKLDGREFLVFYVGDYDAASWLYQRVPDLWDDPNRGRVPLMWCISPVLSVRAPMAMDYVRRTATTNDYFAASDNGAGYLNPGALQYPGGFRGQRPISGLPSGLDVWRAHCHTHYERWGLSVTGFVIDGFAEGMGTEELDCYQAFSPRGLVWSKGAAALLHKDMPVLRMDVDINDDPPARAADRVLARVADRSIPFHWFRNILKSPTWYVELHDELAARAPQIEWLDAPTFFELLRIYLDPPPIESGADP